MANAAPPQVAITIDDIPFVGGVPKGDSVAAATDRILAQLTARGVKATAFVVCDRMRKKAVIVRKWMAAGMGIANHSSTHSHLGLTLVDLDTAMSDPVYARADAYAGHAGISWLYHFAPPVSERWEWDTAQLKALRARFGEVSYCGGGAGGICAWQDFAWS